MTVTPCKRVELLICASFTGVQWHRAGGVILCCGVPSLSQS